MRIRGYMKKDKGSFLRLSNRLTNVDFPQYRDIEVMEIKQKQLALKSLENNKDNIFIAEVEGECIGFIEMKEKQDFFSDKIHAYVATLVVDERAEGKGVAKRLMKHAEDWAVQRDISVLTLDVFASNNRARQFYQHMEFEEDVIKMTKELP